MQKEKFEYNESAEMLPFDSTTGTNGHIFNKITIYVSEYIDNFCPIVRFKAPHLKDKAITEFMKLSDAMEIPEHEYEDLIATTIPRDEEWMLLTNILESRSCDYKILPFHEQQQLIKMFDENRQIFKKDSIKICEDIFIPFIQNNK
jgi:hypothetical protein